MTSPVKYAGLSAGFVPAFYIRYDFYALSTMHLVIRTRIPSPAMADQLQALLGRLDPSLALGSVRPLGTLIGDSASPQRFRASMMGSFALLAVLLSTIGIYALVSYGVSRRIRETGIRMALGAERWDVLRLMLLTGLRPAVTGLLMGGLGAALLGKALSSMLYGVRPLDWTVFLAALAMLLTVSLLACWLPARRASKVDPVASLRDE